MGYKFIPETHKGYTVENGIIIGNLKYGNPQLTPHFKASEFACPCCHVYKIAVKVLEGLENVRVKACTPLEVATAGGSGYRCAKHNADIVKKNPNASPHSKHMLGFAVDVHPTGSLSVASLYSLMDSEPVFHNGGLGRYPHFVHGDCWKKRRWVGK